MGDSVEPLVVGNHNRVFSKLSETMQHELRNRKVVVNTYTEIGYKGLSDVFLNVNAGCPLNRQEKRNAFGTDYADFIRELSNKFFTLLIRIHGTNYKKRLKGDEWLVDTIIFSEMQPGEIFGIAQSKKDYDYTHKVLDKDKVVKNLTIIENIINEIDPAKVRPNSVANVFWLISNYEGEITKIRYEGELKSNNKIIIILCDDVSYSGTQLLEHLIPQKIKINTCFQIKLKNKYISIIW